MKKNNAQHKMFAIISAIAVFLILSALAGCDADSVGQSNEDMTLDLSDPQIGIVWVWRPHGHSLLHSSE